MNEEDLVIKLQENAPAAFDEIVTRYQGMVLNVCNGFVGNREDAEDLAQEVFISIWKKIQDFRGQSSLKTWIYRISVNTSLNHLRKRKYDKLLANIDSALSFTQSSTPHEELKKKEEKNLVRKAIKSLPRQQRIAIILQNTRSLSYKEIAEVMKTSVPSVESLLFRAKKNLARQLMHYYFSDH